jgi:hypothetical protein
MSELMKTQDVDLAAYLHLCGIEPEKRTQSRTPLRNGHFLLEWSYRRTEYLTTCIWAFQSDAVVPARSFCAARAFVKGDTRGWDQRQDVIKRLLRSDIVGSAPGPGYEGYDR